MWRAFGGRREKGETPICLATPLRCTPRAAHVYRDTDTAGSHTVPLRHYIRPCHAITYHEARRVDGTSNASRLFAAFGNVMWRTLNSYGVPETLATSTPHPDPTRPRISLLYTASR